MVKPNKLDPLCQAYAMSLLLSAYFKEWQNYLVHSDKVTIELLKHDQTSVMECLDNLLEGKDSKFWFNMKRFLFLKKSEILPQLSKVPDLQHGTMLLTAFKERPFYGKRISREAAVLEAWRTRKMSAIIMFKLSLQDEDLPLMFNT